MAEHGLNDTEPIIGISNGSVRGTKATHAWTLLMGSKMGMKISGRGPVDGPARRISSFRAELQSQIALFIITMLLVWYSIYRK